MDLWKKFREDGSLGLYVVLGGIVASMRRGGDLPALLRLRWRLRETVSQLDAAHEDLGRFIAARLNAGGKVDPTDEESRTHCRRIAALRAEERRLRDELATRAWE